MGLDRTTRQTQKEVQTVDRYEFKMNGTRTPAILRALGESNHVQSWSRLPREAALT